VNISLTVSVNSTSPAEHRSSARGASSRGCEATVLVWPTAATSKERRKKPIFFFFDWKLSLVELVWSFDQRKRECVDLNHDNSSELLCLKTILYILMK
jgi:hypothetical protein